MSRAKKLLLAALWSAMAGGSAHALPQNCYWTGNGPIVECFHGDKPTVIFMPFQDKRDGLFYNWRQDLRTYCFRNEHGKTRCMDINEVRQLSCGEDGGRVICR